MTIAFARSCHSRGPCARFVALWLKSQGRNDVPTMRQIIDDWETHGVEEGVRLWCDRLRLKPCDPHPGAIALVEQNFGDPLLGILDPSGIFITRSFGTVVVRRKVDIIACWEV